MKPIVGLTRFNLEPVRGIPPPPFTTVVRCLFCDDVFEVKRGAVHAVFRCAVEVIALVCDDCLEEKDRETLARLREQRVKASK